MNESPLARTIADLARPLAASLHLAVWGVEVPGGAGEGRDSAPRSGASEGSPRAAIGYGKRALIRVYVEGENGTDIDACAELSRLLGLALDVEDLIPAAYVLEVSSPGLERTFFTPEQLAASLGTHVAVTLHTPTAAYPGRKNILGTLTEASGGTFAVVPLDVPPKDQAGAPADAPLPAVFTWDEVKKAKRAYFPPATPEPAKSKKRLSKPASTTPESSSPEGSSGNANDHIQTRRRKSA